MFHFFKIISAKFSENLFHILFSRPGTLFNVWLLVNNKKAGSGCYVKIIIEKYLD